MARTGITRTRAGGDCITKLPLWHDDYQNTTVECVTSTGMDQVSAKLFIARLYIQHLCTSH